MADPSTNPESGGDTGAGSEPRSSTSAPPSTPRWVKAFGIIALVLLLLIVIALVTGLGGPGDHGPGRHLPSGDAGRHTPLTSAAEGHVRSGGGNGGRRAVSGVTIRNLEKI